MNVSKKIEENIVAISEFQGDLKERSLYILCGKILMACELGHLTDQEGGKYIDAIYDIIKKERAGKSA